MERRGSRLGLHRAAIGLIAALAAFTIAGSGYLFWKNYSDTEAGIRSHAASSAHVVSANIGWALETARQLLRRVDDSLGSDLQAPAQDAASDLSAAIATRPGEVKVYVVDAEGATLLTTDSQVQPIDIRDREYFAAIASGRPWHISSLLVSRLNGEQIFTVSKRLERNGAFAGVAILSFTSDLLKSVWQSLALDELSTVGLLRADGQLVSRYPPPDGPLDLSGYVLFTDYLPAAPSGTYEAISPADGVHRIVGYRRIEGTELIALASVSTDEAFADLRGGTLAVLGLAVPAALGLLLAGYWIFRLLQRDRQQLKIEAEFEAVAEAMPNHVWTAKPNGELDWFNSGVYDYSGLAFADLAGTAWTQIVHPDDLPAAAAAWSAALAAGGQYETQFRIRAADGLYRWHLVRAVPIRNGHGHVERWIGTNTDIENQKRDAEALVISERRFRLSQQAAGIASLELDIATGTVLGSDYFWDIWGLERRDSVPISVLEAIVVPEDRDVRSNEQTRQTGTAATNVEYRIRRADTGQLRWLARHIEFVNDADGKPAKMYGIIQDITEQKEAQARQQMLTHELEHRIKNILAMVSAIASRTLRDTDLETAKLSFTERLQALGKAHDILTSTKWTEASISDVVRATIAPLPVAQIDVAGPEVMLGPKEALSLALAINELGTNALKYGALSVPHGKVSIVWTVDDADPAAPSLSWRWQETGGPPVEPPTRKGFGTFLITRVLGGDFGGAATIEYGVEGVVCQLTAPRQPRPTAGAGL